MQQIKTSELTGAALDWAVAKCEGVSVRWSAPHEQLLLEGKSYYVWQPHNNWEQGGPIIEREKIELVPSIDGTVWYADRAGKPTARMERCATPLIAAMRCYVASKLGGVVDISEELL